MRFTMLYKHIVCFTLPAVLLMLALGIYMSSSIRNLSIERAINVAKRDVEIIQAEFSRNFNHAVEISRQLHANRSLMQLINRHYSSAWEAVEAYLAFNIFDVYLNIYRDSIDNIRVYANNDTILEGWHLNRIDDAITQTGWFAAASKNPSRIIWIPTRDKNAFARGYNQYSLALYFQTDGRCAVILIDINREILNRHLQSFNFDTVILDMDGYIISTNNSDKSAESMSYYGFDNYTFNREITLLDGFDDGFQRVIMADIALEGINGRFRIVSFFRPEDILRESDALFRRYLVIVITCILFMGILMYVFSRGMSRRVSVLSQEMEQVSRGDFNIVSRVTGNDEIQHLSQMLNIMATNLNKLVKENYEINYQKQALQIKHNDIKLRLLVNQMNPHFLFNTLENIRMEAHIRKEKVIADAIGQLGNLLRQSIQTGGEERLFTDELALVQEYINIQIFRYEDRIKYSCMICDSTKDIKILPFLVQPIVENAIIHGLEGSKNDGEISLRAYAENGTLIIEVTDNGAGLSGERLQEIRDSLENDTAYEDGSIGLCNVHMRIQLHYGPPYGLEIDSEENRFTKVIIKIPAHY